jgi:small subunit ribosomal protein S4e
MNGSEVTKILNDKESYIRIDSKIRRDRGFPAGLMDVVTLDKTGEHYRVLYDEKGRFILKSIDAKEAKYKLLRVKCRAMGVNKIPYIVTHDGRTIRYPHPAIDANDTIKYDLESNKILDYVKSEVGNICFVNAGNNIGRIGVIQHHERHPGGFDIIHIKDENGKHFATRLSNIFIIGKGKQPWISLPENKGLWFNALEERTQRGKH